ncbi:MAG: restriction endonuclease subunit S domain-containing protein [Saccharofermentanales bacterium]
MVDVSTYTTVKDSGIDWIGDIPESWNVRTIYQLASQVKCKNSDLLENNLLSLSYGKIKRKDINAPEGLLPASFDGYNIIEAGDIVLRLTDLQNDHTSLRVGLSTERGIITSAYTTLRPLSTKHSKYVYYLLHAFDLKKGFYGMGSGVRQGLNYDEVKELRVVLPSDTELDAITVFLDDQCGQIDSIIEEAKASIEEYKSWKVSNIDEAVTKGLDPSVEMKDSGVQWIGGIPKSWSTLALKHIVSYNTETLPEDTNPNTEFDYVDIGSVTYGKGIEQYQHMYFRDAPSRARRVVHENDVILSTVRTYLKAVAQIPKSEVPIIVSTGFLVLTANERIEPSYLPFVIQSSPFVSEIEARSVGMSYPAINASEAVSVKVCLPSIAEQEQMAIMLQSKCSKIDEIIDDKNAFIKDLEAYKKSLIYEVVTGKRKVV